METIDDYHPEIVAELEKFIERDDVVDNDGTIYELDGDISVLDMAANVLARQKELSDQASIP